MPGVPGKKRDLFDFGVVEPSSYSSCRVRFDLPRAGTDGAGMVVADIRTVLLYISS